MNLQQSFSHKLVVPDKNIRAASIMAVDVCGQKSELSHFALTDDVTSVESESTFLTSTNCTILANILGGIAGLFLLIYHFALSAWWSAVAVYISRNRLKLNKLKYMHDALVHNSNN